MNARTRWIIGLLLAVIVGLGVGLVVAAGDNGEDETDSVTLETDTEETETTETVEPTVTEPTTPTEGGVSPPADGKPDSSGGLGVEQ